MQLVDLGPDDPRLISDALPVLRELRPHLTAEAFAAVYREGHPQGLRFIAAFLDGRCVGVAGWRIVATTNLLRRLYVDDLITAADTRSNGVGAALIAELERRARAAGCTALDLDSGVHRHDAHRFYFRERLVISAYHFAMHLDPPPAQPPPLR